MTERRAFATDLAPQPAGTYSQALRVGDMIFLSGQTPRDLDGVRRGDLPFRGQVELVMQNLAAVAAAAGCSLVDAAKVTVYLTETADAAEFDEVYRRFIGMPAPARTLVRSPLVGFSVEVDAIIYAPADAEITTG
jgi:2-iminobutanoate/2-iminopropanoate deaminase